MAEFRIATYNIEDFGPRSGGRGDTGAAAMLRRRLDALDADVLCLQEVNALDLDGDGTALDALDALIDGTGFAAFHRAVSHRAHAGDALDIHNLVVLSRRPFAVLRQYWHDLVPEQPVARTEAGSEAFSVRWDRPVLHAAIDLGGGAILDVLNMHLKAPIAAHAPGLKADGRWTSGAAWAQGFYLATIKRIGQALEARLAVDAILNERSEASICVCGDLNATVDEMPLRLLTAAAAETDDPRFAPRALIALADRVAAKRRYSVIHDGRPLLVDHLLASAALARRCRAVAIANEGLADEVRDEDERPVPTGSFHAPVVATFEMD